MGLGDGVSSVSLGRRNGVMVSVCIAGRTRCMGFVRILGETASGEGGFRGSSSKDLGRACWFDRTSFLIVGVFSESSLKHPVGLSTSNIKSYGGVVSMI